MSSMIKFISRVPPVMILLVLVVITVITAMTVCAFKRTGSSFTVIQYSDTGSVIETWNDARLLDTIGGVSFTDNKTGKAVILPSNTKYTIKEN